MPIQSRPVPPEPITPEEQAAEDAIADSEPYVNWLIECMQKANVNLAAIEAQITATDLLSKYLLLDRTGNLKAQSAALVKEAFASMKSPLHATT